MCCGGDVTETEVTPLPDEHTTTTPEHSHRPRDVPFLLLFLGMLGGMGYLAHVSIMKGDPYRYVMGLDSWGNVCGRNNREISGVTQSGKDFRNQTFEFHMALNDIHTALNPTNYFTQEKKLAIICVKECPVEIIDCKQLLVDNNYDLNLSTINNRACVMSFDIVFPQKTLLNRCIPGMLVQLNMFQEDGSSNQNATNPDQNNGIKANYTQSFVASLAQYVLTSTQKYWKDAVYLSLISFFLCFLVLILLQIFTRVIVALILIVGGLGSVILAVILWYNYGVAKGYIDEEAVSRALGAAAPASRDVVSFVQNQTVNHGQSVTAFSSIRVNDSITTVNTSGLLDSLAFAAIQQSQWLLPGCITVTIITIFLLLILVAVRKSLYLTILLFDEASKAVFSMPCIVLQPIKTLAAMTALCCYFFIIAAYIMTVTVPQVSRDGFVKFVEDPELPLLSLIIPHVFGCLWILEFIFGCEEIILAITISNWFFTRKKEKEHRRKVQVCPTFRSTLKLIAFHLGTVALGSLIIAIVRFLRLFLGYIQRQLHGRQNETIQFFVKCLQCCLLCLEKVLKYINRNAYICAAMYGTSFFTSGKKAVSLLVNNAQHVVALNCLSGFCLLIGRIAVATLTGLTGYLWFKCKLGSDAQLKEFLVPMSIACVAAYIIARCFLNVYAMAIDTIFLCFCDDQQRNNGEDRPYYSSKSLQKYMDKAAAAAVSQPKQGYLKSNKVAPAESARSNYVNHKAQEQIELLSLHNIHQQAKAIYFSSKKDALTRSIDRIWNELQRRKTRINQPHVKLKDHHHQLSNKIGLMEQAKQLNLVPTTPTSKEKKLRTPTPFPLRKQEDYSADTTLPFVESTRLTKSNQSHSRTHSRFSFDSTAIKPACASSLARPGAGRNGRLATILESTNIPERQAKNPSI